LHFPLRQGTRPDTRQLQPSPRTAHPAVAEQRQATILLVEDAPGVRSLATRILTRHGYRVIAAANGHEALLEAERHAAEIDVVVSDVVMPGISGREVVDRLSL
jgi:two-component system, cell cycle sensor histidine kinase and response regulator CckA